MKNPGKEVISTPVRADPPYLVPYPPFFDAHLGIGPVCCGRSWFLKVIFLFTGMIVITHGF